MNNVGNTHETKEPHGKENNNKVCTPTPSEDSNQLESPPNGTRAFAVCMKMFKVLVHATSRKRCFGHIEGRMPSADLSHRYAQMVY